MKKEEKMRNIDETLNEIADKINILSGLLVCTKKNVIKNIIAIDIMQTLILAEYKLRDEKVATQEKINLCEMLCLLFMQVTKLEKAGGKL